MESHCNHHILQKLVFSLSDILIEGTCRNLPVFPVLKRHKKSYLFLDGLFFNGCFWRCLKKYRKWWPATHNNLKMAFKDNTNYLNSCHNASQQNNLRFSCSLNHSVHFKQICIQMNKIVWNENIKQFTICNLFFSYYLLVSRKILYSEEHR